MPKVSVIMPVYNVERFVAAAVQSVLAQTFTDFELLVIADLSPDGSIAICQGFDDPRIRIIRHEFNRGLAGARNTGVRNAKGDLLAFLDSDEEIVRAANLSVTEIFERYGEPFFREKEAQVLARLLDGQPGVLSTGGGAFLAARNREAIAEKGVAVWLDADVATLWDRVRHQDTRPLLRTPDPRATLAQIFAERTPIYALAGMRVAVGRHATIEETTQSVIDILLTRPDILEIPT